MGNSAGYETLNTTTLIMIAVGMIAAVIVIAFGTRLSRRRKAAQAAVEADQGTAAVSGGGLSDNDATDLPAAAEAAAPAPVDAPPAIAPAPPPLAESEVVASAPEPVAPSAPTAAGADDLTRIKGLGPKVAGRLNELGVTSYGQLAALSPADAEALDAQMGNFKGRMARDRWVEQAGYLAKGDTAGFEAAFGRL